MINLNTPDEQIIAEINEEIPRAIYWLKKHFGGEEKYERMRDAMLDESTYGRKTVTSEIVEYKSRNGNRWRLFECARYFPESHASHVSPFSFIYYDTYGSCGAFIPTKTRQEDNLKHGCVIYTSHFFERMCERLGIEFRSSEMIAKFVEMIPLQILQKKSEKEGGLFKCDISLPGSIGRGVIRRLDEPVVIEIRTFLTTSQLTPRQLRDTETLRKAQKLCTYEPEEMKMARALSASDINAFIKGELDGLEAMGHNRELVEESINTMLIVTDILIKLDIVKYYEFSMFRDVSKGGLDMFISTASRIYALRKGMPGSEDVIALLEILILLIDISKHNRLNLPCLSGLVTVIGRDYFGITDLDYIDEDALIAYVEQYRNTVKRIDEKILIPA